jgi:Kef-type K+ transport system membrane component KefB
MLLPMVDISFFSLIAQAAAALPKDPLYSMPMTDPVLVMALLSVLLLLAPLMSRQFRLPALVVLILLGMIVGENVVGLLARDAPLKLLERVGLLYIMLLAGIQMDLSNLKRLGIRALVFGLATFGIPLGIGMICGWQLGLSLAAIAIFGVIYSPHTLVGYPIVSRLGMAQQEFVGVAVGGTVITSFLTLTAFSIIQATTKGAIGIDLWIKLGIGLPILIVASFWGIPKLGKSLLASKEPGQLIFQYTFIFATLFVVSGLTALLQVDSIVGAFIAGLALNSVVTLDSPLMKQIEFVGNSLFIPFFMISVGVLCNPTIFFTAPENIGIAILIIATAVFAKWLAAEIPGRIFGYTAAQRLSIASLTMTRAALVLVIMVFAKEAQLINEGIFNAAIAYILVTCLFGPLITEWTANQIASVSAATSTSSEAV